MSKHVFDDFILIGDNAFRIGDIRRVGVEETTQGETVGVVWLRDGEKISVPAHEAHGVLGRVRND